MVIIAALGGLEVKHVSQEFYAISLCLRIAQEQQQLIAQVTLTKRHVQDITTQMLLSSALGTDYPVLMDFHAINLAKKVECLK
jgi:hypothetical protein